MGTYDLGTFPGTLEISWRSWFFPLKFSKLTSDHIFLFFLAKVNFLKGPPVKTYISVED